jgi:hypothetical protein
MSDKERALFIRLRGLLLLAVDLIDRECQLGKYAAPKILEPSATETYTVTSDKILSV